MANRKISDLTALTTPASGDYLPIVDISEAAAADKNKRITVEELMRGVPSGTAGAPGIAFEADPNTGIYSPGADQLALSTNGTGRFFVDASGNVGVGTASPLQQFHVLSSSTFNARFESSTTIALIRFANSTASDGYIGYVNQNLVFYAANAERARIDSSGRLLVGTSSDSGGALLQVNGDRIRVATAKTPASASDTGTAGEICWDASYIYVCTATNTWKRAALATW